MRASNCCGIAWVSDTTLHHEVNLSRQHVHELKTILEDAGDCVIVARSGYTSLYFVPWQGLPVAHQDTNRAGPGSTHEPGCSLRKGEAVPADRGLCA